MHQKPGTARGVPSPQGRRWLAWLVGAGVALTAPTARASSSFELFGPLASGNALTARTMSRSAAAAYFNPSLLPGAAPGTEVSFAFVTTRADIELDERPGGEDVPASVYGARFPDADDDDLRPFATAELPEKRADTRLRDSTAYAAIGVVRPLFDEKLVFGFYGILPIQSFHSQESFFADEREQYFSNALHFELLGDRAELASFAVALASQPDDWIAFGAGVEVTIGTQATTAVYVPNAADQREVLLNPDVEVDSVFSPFFGLTTYPSKHLSLTSTLHFPVSSDTDGENRLRFFNFNYEEGEDSVDQVFRSSTGYVPLRASIGGVWASRGVDAPSGWEVGVQGLLNRWSSYRDRHGERPRDSWQNTVTLGVGAAATFDRKRASADVHFAPSPVPDQRGRSNYVDNARLMVSTGFEAPARVLGVGFALGAYLHGQWLVPRDVRKSPDAPHPVFDEYPGDAIDVVTNEPIADAQGFQTNNPGYPGFSSGASSWVQGSPSVCQTEIVTRGLSLVLLATLGVAGCGGSDESGDNGSGGAGGAGGGAGGSGGASGAACGVPEPSGDPGDLTGKWAYFETAGRLAIAPAIPDPIANQTIFVALLDVTQTGTDLTIDGLYCDHRVEDPDAIVHTVIPDTYRAALKPFTRMGTFAAGATGGLRFLSPKLYEVLGADLTNIETEPLPTDPDDPRVTDDDADGNPGVTVRLTGIVDGEIYVVNRRWTALDGAPVASDRIEGVVEFEPEEIILASDPESIKDTSPTSARDPDECRSQFAMARAPDTADCAWVNDNVSSLFP